MKPLLINVAAMLVMTVCGCDAADPQVWKEGGARFQAAMAAFDAKQFAEAADQFTQAIANGGLTADQFVDAHVRRAVCRAMAKDFAGAHADLDLVAGQAPNLDLVHSARSAVFRAEGKTGQADTEMSKAKALNPRVISF